MAHYVRFSQQLVRLMNLSVDQGCFRLLVESYGFFAEKLFFHPLDGGVENTEWGVFRRFVKGVLYVLKVYGSTLCWVKFVVSSHCS